MRKIKKILSSILCLVIAILCIGTVSAQVAPSYDDDFSSYLLSGKADKDGRIANVYNITAVSADKNIMTNIRCLFYPNAYAAACGNTIRGGLIWSVFRYIGLGILVLFLCVVGANFIIHPDKPKEHLMSLVYILYGAALFFGVTWILGSVLDVSVVEGTEGLVNAVQGSKNSIGFKIIAFLKALVFFLAIIMLVVNGFKAMSQADKSDKARAAIRGIVNVIVALVIIKVVDYIYFIAQSADFISHATKFIIEVAKILGFIVGSLLVVMAFYAGFLFIVDGGKGENMKKATKIIVGIVLVASVIFLLLLIMYQFFAEFA